VNLKAIASVRSLAMCFDGMFRAETASCEGESSGDRHEFRHKRYDEGEYPCIFLPSDIFIGLIQNLKDHVYNLSSLSFVDAGCGLGHKLVLAYALGFLKITGLEIDPLYCQKARTICRNIKEHGRVFWHFEPEIKKEDIIQSDFSSYDVIYFYHPLSDDKKQTRFEKRVVDTAKKGAIIIPVGHVSLSHALSKKKLELLDKGSFGCPIYKRK
jgi:SAM-dependent methyltransferase